MATLQKLRNQAGLLLAIVIFIALAAFILGDLLKSGSSIIRGQQLEIAEIDGESIEYPEFQERFESVSSIYKQNNQTNTIDDVTYQQILNQAWDDMVKEIIMTDIYDDLGITVTSDEMFDMVQGNNLHPIINQVFGNKETGQVDKNQIIQFLKYIQENPNAPQKDGWLNIEKEILKAKKTSKYNDLVAKGLYANSLQAKQSIASKNKIASLKYIQKKIKSIADSTISVTDSELKKYYNDHIEEYDQDAKKIISYVTFNIVPSEQDEMDVQKWINEIKPDFIKAEDNIQFVNMNSDNRFKDEYLKADDLSADLAGWVSNAANNDVYGPYKEGSVYKLAKLNATKMLPDSVKASHILIRAENQNEAQAAYKIIDSLKTVIDKGLATFEQVAIANSQDGSASDGGNLGWFSRGTMVAPFEKAAFRAEKNEVVQVQTQFGFHLIKVTEQGKKSEHIQLAVIDREVIPSTATYQKLYADASRFASKAENIEGFNAIASTENMSPRRAEMLENDRIIQGLGPSRSLIRAAFQEAKVGQLVMGSDKSPVFELENKFVVAVLVSEKEKGSKTFDEAKSTVKTAVVNEKKKELILNEFTKAKGATIEATASNLNLTAEAAEGFNFNYGSVNTIGYEPAINGAAEALEVNQLSNPIVGREGVYYIVLTEIENKATDDIESEKNALYRSGNYRANYQAYQTIKNNTEIEDKRSKFY